MDRRNFLQAAGTVALGAGYSANAQQGRKPRRVGLIGTGWYGKIDLLRLIQVEPVEVVSLCDVDTVQLQQAADLVASRKSQAKSPNSSMTIGTC